MGCGSWEAGAIPGIARRGGEEILVNLERRIVHVDMDAFFASVEQRDFPELRGLPVAVAGDSDRGVVAAASYEARRFGVRSAMPISRALRLCPQLRRVPPRFSVYSQVSAQIHAIFREFTALLEPLSLDESFLDLSAYCYEHQTKAGVVALAIKRRIREQTGLTASAGVGPNKLIAKIASGFRKPDGLTIVPPHEAGDFLKPLAIGELWGVGPVTEKRFRELGIDTVGQLASFAVSELRPHFGRQAAVWVAMAQGHDDRPVESERETKSISAERTFEENVADLEVLRQSLAQQAEQVAGRLERERVEAMTVQIKLRFGDFTTITRSLSGSRPVSNAEQLRELAWRLLEQQLPLRPIRLIGMGTSQLLPLARPRQLELDFSGS